MSTPSHTLDDLRAWRIANGKNPENGNHLTGSAEKRRQTAVQDLTLIRTFASKLANWDSREGEAMIEIISMCDRAIERQGIS